MSRSDPGPTPEPPAPAAATDGTRTAAATVPVETRGGSAGRAIMVALALSSLVWMGIGVAVWQLTSP